MSHLAPLVSEWQLPSLLSVEEYSTVGQKVSPVWGLPARIALAAQKSAPPPVKVVGTC